MKNEVTVSEMAQIGYRMMRHAKIHPHFFVDHSLYKTALYLIFFYLKLPYEYDNPTYLKQKISESAQAEIMKLFQRRINERIPVEYITEETYYCNHRFYINPNVLVPRSLMSTQFDSFLKRISWQNHRVLDLCTGSGCIGITLALMDPNIKVDLVDISTAALNVASINIKNHKLEDRVKIIQSDLFENLNNNNNNTNNNKNDNKYDLIITNPPYVSEYEYQRQPKEVKNEPKTALIAGQDGLEIIERILSQAKDHLNPNGLLIIEVGYAAAKKLKRKYRKMSFEWTKWKNPKGEDIIDIIIRWSGLLDSILICKMQDLAH